LTFEGKARFWKEAFQVYYNGGLIGTCDQETCLMRISLDP
jgi:hypothetical protein